MFDAIARRYDLLNHLLSAGCDRRWRRRAVRALGLTGRERVVDVCTGTADLAIEAVRSSTGAAREVVGLDFAAGMLQIGLAKTRRLSLDSRVHLVRGDAMHLPLPDRSVDAVMVAFGIRNVEDPAAACAEFRRVLGAGGRLAILEFGTPAAPGLRQLYGWYFRRVLPRIGRLISRHGDAYTYLPASVAAFPAPEAFAGLLRRSGFADVERQSLTLGIVWLYVARAV